MNKIILLSIFIISVILCLPVHATEDIDMAEVRRLAKLSVDTILEDSAVETFNSKNYWKKVHGRNKPLVVFSTQIAYCYPAKLVKKQTFGLPY